MRKFLSYTWGVFGCILFTPFAIMFGVFACIIAVAENEAELFSSLIDKEKEDEQ